MLRLELGPVQAEQRCEKCGQIIPWGERKCPACGEGEGFFWSVSRNELLLLSVLALILLFSGTTFLVKAYRAKERELAQHWYVLGERALAAGHGEAALEDFRSALVYSPDDSLIELQLARRVLCGLKSLNTENTEPRTGRCRAEGLRDLCV